MPEATFPPLDIPGKGALYARFEDVEELLIDLWDAELSHRAITMMTIVTVLRNMKIMGSMMRM